MTRPCGWILAAIALAGSLSGGAVSSAAAAPAPGVPAPAAAASDSLRRASYWRVDDPHLFQRMSQASPVSIHRIVGSRLAPLAESIRWPRDTVASFQAPTIAVEPDRAWVESLAALLARCVWIRSGTGPSLIVRPDVAIGFGPDSSAVYLLVDRHAMRLALAPRKGDNATSMPDDYVGWRLDGLLDAVVPEDPVVLRSGSFASGPCENPIDRGSVPAGHAYEPPRPTVQAQPTYPEAAKHKRIQGRVTLRLLVGRDGLPCRVERVSGPPELVDAAEAAVLEWAFEPARLDDAPVAAWWEFPIDFHL